MRKEKLSEYDEKSTKFTETVILINFISKL